MSHLEIKKLVKQFGNFTALEEINLEIQSNEFIAILGPSGCGKTTLLRSVAGFVEPTAGSIRFNNQTFYQDKQVLSVNERQIGMVFQQFALWPHFDVYQHLMYPLNSKENRQQLTKQEKEMRVKEILELVELSDFSHRYPHELSGGQKQRVALARAIVAKPKLLLMDEPLSALDAHLKESMVREIKKIHQASNATTLYVTHDQKEAMALADRVIVMNQGQIEQFDTPYNLYHHPKTEFVARFVGKAQLIKGIWKEDQFYPNQAVNGASWSAPHIDAHFKQLNTLPILPEQFELCDYHEQGKGIVGKLLDQQFLGRETQYGIQLEDGQELVISSNQPQAFKVHQTVLLNFKGGQAS